MQCCKATGNVRIIKLESNRETIESFAQANEVHLNCTWPTFILFFYIITGIRTVTRLLLAKILLLERGYKLLKRYSSTQIRDRETDLKRFFFIYTLRYL